ncbi:hypothetical protein H5410_062868 [Solanum commersonii]|uniref:Uncharacterized protein n=1 Tax=Solanum commersonii TaxID=4109 RepID=A0A9J5WDZ1_SOLCO|nr:hypothetical protein H5410_062868 [Solanum commersonii]
MQKANIHLFPHSFSDLFMYVSEAVSLPSQGIGVKLRTRHAPSSDLPHLWDYIATKVILSQIKALHEQSFKVRTVCTLSKCLCSWAIADPGCPLSQMDQPF